MESMINGYYRIIKSSLIIPLNHNQHINVISAKILYTPKSLIFNTMRKYLSLRANYSFGIIFTKFIGFVSI